MLLLIMKLISISLATFAQRSLINDDTPPQMGFVLINQKYLSTPQKISPFELPNYKSNYVVVACLPGQVVSNYTIEFPPAGRTGKWYLELPCSSINQAILDVLLMNSAVRCFCDRDKSFY